MPYASLSLQTIRRLIWFILLYSDILARGVDPLFRYGNRGCCLGKIHPSVNLDKLKTHGRSDVTVPREIRVLALPDLLRSRSGCKPRHPRSGTPSQTTNDSIVLFCALWKTRNHNEASRGPGSVLVIIEASRGPGSVLVIIEASRGPGSVLVIIGAEAEQSYFLKLYTTI